MKQCLRCKNNLPFDKFIPNKRGSHGLNGWCRDCTKDSMLQKKYGISLLQYNQLLIDQQYKCKLCGTSKPLGNRNVFVVDHCHTTGQIRGLLCNHCNTGLGKLGDTVEALQRAIRYLQAC